MEEGSTTKMGYTVEPEAFVKKDPLLKKRKKHFLGKESILTSYLPSLPLPSLPLPSLLLFSNPLLVRHCFCCEKHEVR